jgi:hypothetical protein
MQEPETASTSGPEGAIMLASLVWIQRRHFYGLFQLQDPGLLIARGGGRINLVTQREKVFEAEKHEIRVKWPWWQFGQGVFLKVASKTYWFAWIPGTTRSPAQITDVVSTLTWREGFTGDLANSKAWRGYLKT